MGSHERQRFVGADAVHVLLQSGNAEADIGEIWAEGVEGFEGFAGKELLDVSDFPESLVEDLAC